MSSPVSSPRQAGQASVEATGLVVLVALLFVALAAWAPGAITLPIEPPPLYERLGSTLGVSSPSLEARSTTNPVAWHLVPRGGNDAPIGNFLRAGRDGIVAAPAIGGALVASQWRASRDLLLEDAPAPADAGPARAAARLLRRGLARAAVDVAVFSLAQRIERLKELLSVDLETFVWIKKVGRFVGGGGIDTTFDWNDDSCSLVPNFRFTNDCGRHDFAYRNAKALGVFSRLKRTADDRLARDMAGRCARSVSPIAALGCAAWTAGVWGGVRTFGDTSPGDVPALARKIVAAPVCSTASALTLGRVRC